MNKTLRTLFLLALGLALAHPTHAATVAVHQSYASLTASGSTVTLALQGATSGASIKVAAGCVCSVTPKFSFDGGNTYVADYSNPVFILPLVGNSAAGSLKVPPGATHVRAEVTAYTSGSTGVTLTETSSAGVHAASATGSLVAASTPDYVALPVDPKSWASVVVTLSGGPSASTVLWEHFVNGAWVATPLAALQGGQTNAASVAFTTTVSGVYDVPLAANATQVRVRMSAFTSGSVTATITQGRPLVSRSTPTYFSSVTALTVAASATDVCTLTGSATKTIRVLGVQASGVQTTAGAVNFVLAKRSTANTGGTSSSGTVGTADSVNGAGTATVLAYTANPTTGTLNGNVDATHVHIPTATSTTGGGYSWVPTGQAVTLRGIADVLAVNLAGITVTGGVISCRFTWTEE